MDNLKKKEKLTSGKAYSSNVWRQGGTSQS